MSGRPQRWVCPLDDATVVRIGGADALSFLQSKLTSDTRRWRIHGGGYALATDINGRILFDGHFALDGGTILAVIPSSVAHGAVEHLERYVIMEDVELAIEETPTVIAVGGPDAHRMLGVDPDDEPSRARAVTLGEASPKVFFAPGPVAGAGHWLAVVCGGDTLPAIRAMTDRDAVQITRQELEAMEVRQGIPRLGRDFWIDRTLPLEAGLWNGVSLSKGCYLGQEVLERLFSRGSAARRLVVLEWDGAALEPGTPIRCGDEEVGALTASAPNGSGSVGMGWLKRRALDSDEPVVADGGTPLRVAGLVGGPDPESP